MPDLKQSLQGHDLGHLRIAAELWGIEIEASEARAALEEFIDAALQPDRIADLLETLPPEARTALDELLISGGRMPWPHFTRQFGEVREMGPGRRDREQPHRNPVSAAEMLFYRGLVGRAFFDSPTGPEEFAYVPEDLIQRLPAPENNTAAPFGRPASAKETTHIIPANDWILDDACTLLAALRLGKSPSAILDFFVHPDACASLHTLYPLTPKFLTTLLGAGSLLDPDGLPQPEPARAFLEASRGEALSLLGRAWLDSETLNELRLMPGLEAEGEWQNDPRQTRKVVLTFLSGLPEDTWWSLEGFISGVREKHPDFQRPAGDYDSWFIRDLKTGEYLRGFEHWDQVDGALLRYLITGPLHWVGFIDLAAPGKEQAAAAFRFSKWSSALLRGGAPEGLVAEESPITVTSNAQMVVPRLTPRVARYQISRLSVWEKKADDKYTHRLSPASLERAREQGLQVSHLEAILKRYAEAVPPSLIKALQRWEAKGTEARLAQALVLRVRSADILTELRSSRAARFLGEPLGPLAVIVKPGAWQKVLDYLAEMGYLGEAEFENEML